MDDYLDDSDTDNSYSPHPTATPTGPYVRIVEQPAKCGVRFRYECEGRISGAIPGANSTTLNPTFPTIRVFNFSGRAKVVVSCVTKNPPFRAHPHNLVGKKSCKDGVCSLVFGDGICAFNNLGILCAKRKDIRERLKLREVLRVDPFGSGFGHKSQAFKIIDLAVIRLCFQVYLENPQTGQLDIPLDPIVSDPIYDKKAMSELAIAKLSHYSAPVTGGTDIILLCDRVIKDDIQIRFYEERNERLFWEAFADFKANDIHKHFAISFRSPKYCDFTVGQPIAVNIQLVRPSDGGASESLPFYLLPRTDSASKRQRMSARAAKHVRNDLFPTDQSCHVMPDCGDVMAQAYAGPRYVASGQHEYILPRLLSRADNDVQNQNVQNELLSQSHGLDIDFDINCIQLEDNVNSISAQLDHFWPEDHKDVVQLQSACDQYCADDNACVQLLDISDCGGGGRGGVGGQSWGGVQCV